ncbi:MAG: PIN domain protein [Candidatus Brocadiia bacterium]
MRKIRVYVDTSVFGGTQDEEFAEATKRFFDRVHQGRFRVLVSQVTADELTDAPPAVQAILRELPRLSIERVTAEKEVLALAMAYIAVGALGPAQRADAIHVATATVARADLILSWNFKHIVNFDRIHKFNAVNLKRGYPQIEIRSPLEVEYGDEDQDV